MEFIQAIILGIVQGLTEFLPISSSGHLVLAQHFFGWESGGDISFELFVHLGSLVAVLIFFRLEIWTLLKSVVYFKDRGLVEERKMCLWIVIATLVTAIVGYPLKGFFESLFTSPLLVACMLAVTGWIVFLSDKIDSGVGRRFSMFGFRHSDTKDPDGCLDNHQDSKKPTLNALGAAFIGFGQALAITPGISRSGTTITCSLLTGLDRKTAARFSFLLSIPAILGANVSETKTLFSLDTSQLLLYLTGFLCAFISGYLVIGWLLKLIQKARLRYFSYYCWTIALLSTIYIIIHNT